MVQDVDPEGHRLPPPGELRSRLRVGVRQDVVNRISPGVRLEDYWGILDDEAAEELREAVTDGRDRRHETRAVRRDRIVTELSSDEANPSSDSRYDVPH